MTGFKDWLTQISGAICHAPTGRRSPPLPATAVVVALSASASLHPFFERFFRPLSAPRTGSLVRALSCLPPSPARLH